jgi:hypothetical protein
MDKRTELKDLKSFLDLINFYVQDIIPDEKPDFMLINNGDKIGIELTEYNPPDKYAHDIRSVHDTFEIIKSELTEDLGKITTEFITFNFSLRKPILKRIKKSDKAKIKSFFIGHLDLPEVKNSISTPIFHLEFNYKENESEFIESVRISKSPRNDSIYVSTNDMYWSGHIPETNIQTLIDKKERLVDFSKNKDNWLLIILPEQEYSDGAYINETVENEFRTRFDKAYIYTRLRRKIYELKLASR